MQELEQSLVNRQKLVQAERAWRELVERTLKRGFHGKVLLEIAVQDGTIQHVRRTVEQLER